MKMISSCALFAVSFLGTAAYADTVTLTLNPAAVATAPGTTATYTATISALASNTAAVYLNGDSITLAGPLDLVIDDSDLLLNFDAFLNPGASETFALFTVSVPASETFGSYAGSYVLQGGADDAAQGALSTQPFLLTVGAGSPTAVTPEPSSYLLLSSGLLAGFGLMKRKRTACNA